MNQQIFVYGTLMEGFSNYNIYLKGKVVKIESAYIYGSLYHINEFDCPALLPGNDTVYGEVIEFKDDDNGSTMNDIDEMESYYDGSDEILYKRIETDVFMQDKKIKLGVYHFVNTNLFNELEKVYLPNGDWREYMKSHSCVK